MGPICKLWGPSPCLYIMSKKYSRQTQASQRVALSGGPQNFISLGAPKGHNLALATRYNIEPWNIYNPYSGLTNNVAESLNAVVKWLLDWKELPLDCLCLSMYYLQSFYFTEIQRGLIGVGEYRLRKEFWSLQQDPCELKIPKSYAQEEIVEAVKMKIYALLKCELNQINTSETESEMTECSNNAKSPLYFHTEEIKD